MSRASGARPDDDAAPRVSIVVPARDAAATLGACLGALARQTYPSARVEWVVVDDASTDATADVARRSGARVVRAGAKNRAAARNLGNAAATGDLVAFVDADCVVGDDWLARLAAAVAAPGVHGAWGPVVPDVEGRGAARPIEQLLGAMARAASDGDARLPVMTSGACLLRRDVFADLGGFDPALTDLEDVDLTWRLFFAGYVVRRLDAAAVTTRFWRGRADRVVARAFEKGRAARQLRRKWDDVARAHGVAFDAPPWDVDAASETSGAAARLAVRVLRAAHHAGDAIERVTGTAQTARAAIPIPIPTHARGGGPIAPTCRVVLTDDAVRLYDLAGARRLVFRGVEKAVLEKVVAERRPLDDAARALALEFDADEDRIRADVRRFVDDLARGGLWRQEGAECSGSAPR